METQSPIVELKTITTKVPIPTWQAVASLVIMGGTGKKDESIAAWVREAIEQRLEREYPNVGTPESTG